MKALKGVIVFASLMAGVSGQAMAQSVAARPSDAPFKNADGTTTTDRNAAEASWRADAEFRGDWGLAAIKAEGAYAQGFTGKGVKLGDIDTGTYRKHPEFDPARFVYITATGIRTIDDTYNPFKAGEPFTLDGGTPWFNGPRVESHGTHTAGTIAASRDGVRMMGVAYESILYSGNGEGLGPTNGFIDTFDPAVFVNELDQMVAAGVRAVNGSWGIGGGDFASAQGARRQYHDAPANQNIDAMVRAAQKDVVMVLANGNDGLQSEPDAKSGAPYFRQDPYIEQHWVTVANNSSSMNLNSGSTRCGYTKYWCVAAPGTNILGTIVTGTPDNLKDGYGNKTGTSMAAPHVTGALGIIMERFPYMTSGQAADVLKTTSTDMGEKGIDVLSGWGQVNLTKAMDGPGQFINRFNADLGSGVRDVWRNDISQEALDQRKTEESAEIVAWTARKAALGLTQGLPGNLEETLTPSATAGMANGKKLLEAAISANTRATYTAAKFGAALNAARADAVGKILLDLYEAANPGWESGYSLLTDYPKFIDGRSDDAIAKVVAENQGSVIRLEFRDMESRTSYLATKTYEAGLTKSGLGSLTLTGSNTYRGDTIVDGGELTIAKSGSITSKSVANASGLLRVEGTVADVSVVGGNLVVLNGGSAANVSVTAKGLADVASGGAVGNVSLLGGFATINGRAGFASVDAGGVLRGNGHVATLAVLAKGTVSPGNSVGVLRVDGDARFAKGSVLDIEVNQAGQMDLLDVAGKAILEGGTVSLRPEGKDGLVSPDVVFNLLGKSNTVVTAAGGVTGRFEGALPGYTFIGAMLNYGANTVTLSLGRNSLAFADVAQTTNQRAVGNAIERLGRGNALYNNLIVSTDTANLPANYDSLSGEIHASLASNILLNDDYFTDAVIDRLSNPKLAFAGTETAESTTASGWTIWGRALTGFGRNDGNQNVAKVRESTTGIVTGFDKNFGDAVQIGLAVGYLDTQLTANRRASSASDRGVYVGGYAGAALGAVNLRGGGNWSSHRSRTDRNAALNAFSVNLRDTYNSQSWNVFGEAGVGLNVADLALEPYARIQRSSFRSSLIDEGNSPAALSGKFKQRLTSSFAGLRMAGLLTEREHSNVALILDVAWRRNLDYNDRALARLHFAGGDDFSIEGAGLNKDSARVDAGLNAQVSQNLVLTVNYTGQYSKGYERHSAKAGLRYAF